MVEVLLLLIKERRSVDIGVTYVVTDRVVSVSVQTTYLLTHWKFVRPFSRRSRDEFTKVFSKVVKRLLFLLQVTGYYKSTVLPRGL